MRRFAHCCGYVFALLKSVKLCGNTGSPTLTSMNGLTTQEARKRLDEFGPNEPVSSRRTSGLTQILFLFINPLAIILLIASANISGRR